MAGMRLLPVPHRRATVVALLVVAGFCLALVGLALTNPWRLTALYPLASTGGMFATLTLAGALVAAAVLLVTAAQTGRRAVAGLMIALVAIPALCVGVPAATLGGVLRDRRISAEQVLATSPGGRYSVVAVTFASGTTELFVRSRRGLLSREAPTPLARCTHDPFAGDLPPESVRFTDEHRVALPVLAAGVTVTVAFDASSLAPEQTVDLCES